MTVERIHPKAPVMLIFIAIFTCLPSCINLSNIINCIFKFLKVFQQVKLRLVIPGSKDKCLLSICRMLRVTVH